MRVLGIESSSLVASVALVTDDILTAEYTVDFKKTHSQTLLPMLDEIVKLLELDMDTIDAIAVAGSPGSFTGLRIGAAPRQGTGSGSEKALGHVPTVDAMAYNMWGAEGLSVLLWTQNAARSIQGYTIPGTAWVVMGAAAHGYDGAGRTSQ